MKINPKILRIIILVCLSIIPNLAVLALEFDLIGDLSTTFDDNINVATDSRSDEKLHDFVTNLSFNFGATANKKTYRFELLGHLFQQLYLLNHAYNNNYQDATLNFAKEFTSHDRFIMSFMFMNYPEPEDLESSFNNSQGRAGFFSYTCLANVQKVISQGVLLNLFYRFQHYDYKGDNLLVDTTMHAPSAVLDYSINTTHMLSLFYEFRYLDYASGIYYKAHSPAMRYRYSVTQQLYAELRIGYDFIETSEVQYFNKPFFTFAVINDVDRNSRISFICGKRYALRMGSDSIVNNWWLQGEFRRYLIARLLGAASFYYGQGEYLAVNTEVKFFGINLAAYYDLAPNIAAYVQYNYLRSKTWIEGDYIDGYSRNRTSIGCRGTF